MKCIDGVSVVVCCYNSAARLPNTVEHLAKQITAPNFNWEVIIVDNHSTDNTSETAQNELMKYLSLKNKWCVILEAKAGLNYARHAGVAKAKYEYIIFCDDDNYLNENYVSRCYTLLHENTKIGVAGGLGEAVADNKIPVWFYSYQHFYAVGCQSFDSGFLIKRNYVFGAGMAFRKSVYQRINEAKFNYLTTDRKGDSLSSGGDVELCYIHLLTGYQLYYDEALSFQHYMSESRLKKDYAKRLLKSGIDSANLLNGYLVLYKCLHYSIAKRLVAFCISGLKLAYQYVRNDNVYKLQLEYLEALHVVPFIRFSKKIINIRQALRRYQKLIKDSKQQTQV